MLCRHPLDSTSSGTRPGRGCEPNRDAGDKGKGDDVNKKTICDGLGERACQGVVLDLQWRWDQTGFAFGYAVTGFVLSWWSRREAWCRSRVDQCGKQRPMARAAGRVGGGGPEPSAESDGTRRPRAASNPDRHTAMELNVTFYLQDRRLSPIADSKIRHENHCALGPFGGLPLSVPGPESRSYGPQPRNSGPGTHGGLLGCGAMAPTRPRGLVAG